MNLRRIKQITLAAIASSLVVAQTPATGIRARATPADYAVSQQSAGLTYAASLLPPDQVRHLFTVDISKTYLVLEVACYPSQSADATISPNDFLIKSESPSEYIHPSDASTIASLIQDKNTPRLPSRGPAVVTTAGVGVEHVSGPGVHGTTVYTEAGVGVGNDRDNYPPPPPRPGTSPQDRVTLENQLADKSLPQGTFRTPVAGYLYFVADALKKTKGNYDLQYLTSASAKVDLEVPSKVK